MTTAMRRLKPEMSPEEMEMARVAQRCIGESLDRARAASIRLTSEDGEHSIQLPTKSLRLIGEVLGALSVQGAVTIVSSSKELTTLEAANYLNVSRPFVIRELEAGRIPYRMVGSHRRILFDDLYNYNQKMCANRKDALEKLADESSELRLDF